MAFVDEPEGIAVGVTFYCLPAALCFTIFFFNRFYELPTVGGGRADVLPKVFSATVAARPVGTVIKLVLE